MGLLISLLLGWTIFRSSFRPTLPSTIDEFLTSTICGRLIRYGDTVLSTDELAQLQQETAAYLSFPKDCSFFTHRAAVSLEESVYPLAFTILVYTNLEQFEFLLRTIYRESNYYCVHVDLKAPATLYQAIQARTSCVRNIYLPAQRVNVTWGRFSVLEAERLCQNELLLRSRRWKYYFNLANSDIPLKTNAELVQILKMYNDQNDITSLPYRSLLRQKNPFRLVNRTLPSSIPPLFYKGEFHVLLSRSAIEYILSDQRVSDLYHFLEGTSVPDEHYYSTINRWKETPGYYPHDHDLNQLAFMTRYKLWGDRPEHALCQGSFVRGICVFNYADLWHLATSPHLFANKIYFQHDRSAAYCVAQYLEARDRMKREDAQFSMVDENFYRQLRNVAFGKGSAYTGQ